MTRHRIFLMTALATFCMFKAASSTQVVQQQQISQRRQQIEQSQQNIQRSQSEWLNQLQRQLQEEQQEQMLRQQQLLLQQQREESAAKNPQVDVLKEHLLPDDNGTLEELDVEVALLTNGKSVKSKKNWLSIPRDDYFRAISEQEQQSTSMKKMANPFDDGFGPYSCCRRATGIQIKERKGDRYIEFVSRPCSFGYCNTCKNDLASCKGLKNYGCPRNSRFYSFMSAHCPETCGWCNAIPPPQPATRRPPQTPRPTPRTTRPPRRATTPSPVATPSIDPNLQKVTVYFNGNTRPYTYMFATSKSPPRYPWKPVSSSNYRGEVESFYMYKKTTGSYKTRVTFCKARSGNTYKWMITKGQCGRGWLPDFRLYGSTRPVFNSKFLFVYNRGQSPWTSRVTNVQPCCGYVKARWNLFIPKAPSKGVAPPTTKKPITTQRPATTPFKPNTKPPLPPTKPVGPQPTSPFHRECLEYHNFFRSMHNVPALQWDPSLVQTSQRWAKFLANAAPEHPFQTGPGVQRTRNWPHSDRGTYYRGRGVGENIAWDFSREGSPAKESVLRWYAELFYYDRENPTHSHAGKPVGHLTQLLWKDTTHLGCAVAIKNIPRGSYTYKSTYTVSHYSPGGNIVYRTPADTLRVYNKNVPAAKSGTCRSARNCAGDSGCMGFGKGISCGCARDNTGGHSGRPRCTGNGGCIVTCEKPLRQISGSYSWSSECEGQKSCECVYNPVNYKAGAICS